MTDDNSWFKVYRKITDWEWWDDAECVKLLLLLLAKANKVDKKWHGQLIKRGQFITTIRELVEDFKKTTSDKIRLRLERLRDCGTIDYTSQSTYHLITILNYESYQAKKSLPEDEIPNGYQTDTKGIPNGYQTDTKGIPNGYQTDTKGIPTTKEYKNIRNNNIRENPNIIIQEDKNERFFFKSENEKKIFSIEDLKNELGKVGIFLTEQGYKEYKENNEKPDTKFNYSGGFEYSCKQFLKKHPEYIAKQGKPKAPKYEEIEVPPDVNETLQLLSDAFSQSEKKILNAVKFGISDAGDSGTMFLPNKVFFELNNGIILEMGEKLKEFYGLDSLKYQYYY